MSKGINSLADSLADEWTKEVMRRRLTGNYSCVLFEIFHEIMGDRIFAFIAFWQLWQIALSKKTITQIITMKHSEWLRLQVEGDRVVASLRADGFNCRKQPRRLSWYLCKDSVSYTLTWLPAPVCEWSLLPNDQTPDRAQLWQSLLLYKRTE